MMEENKNGRGERKKGKELRFKEEGKNRN